MFGQHARRPLHQISPQRRCPTPPPPPRLSPPPTVTLNLFQSPFISRKLRSSCELKWYRVRKYRAMGSRFRGNDNVGVLGRVNGYSRRPSAGWGLSRLSGKRGAIWRDAIGSSLRWSDGELLRCNSAPLRLCVIPLMCHSRESRNAWVDLSAKWFAQRHEGTKRLLPAFVSSCEPKSCRTRKYKTMGSRFRGNDNVGILGRVNGYSRRPSAGWGLSRLSTKRSVSLQGAIGSSLRWSDVVGIAMQLRASA